MHLPSQDKRQCPYCQISNRLKIPIKTHPCTCASYNPFEVLHLNHIGPFPKDAHGNEYIFVIIDAWVEYIFVITEMNISLLFPSNPRQLLRQHLLYLIILVHPKSFIQIKDHNELVTELLRLGGIEQSFATAYSSEENGIVKRAN